MARAGRSDRDLEGLILDGMARALWVHAYMIWALEVEAPPGIGNQSWDEMAPDNASTRKASMKAARELTGLLEASNRLGAHPLATLFRRAGGSDRDGDVAIAAFGEDVAHVCMGTRDAEDSSLPFTSGLSVPHFSVELDDDGNHISWDGGWTWNGNECNPCRRNGDTPEILVIEDDKSLAKMYPRMIRRIFPGAEVIVVDNYFAAIGYLETHPDIAQIVSDVDILGQRSGIDVFEWVQVNRPELVDKYVFVTGGNPQVARLHYRYLEKPLEGVEQLREMIFRPARGAAPGPSRTISARDLRPAQTRDASPSGDAAFAPAVRKAMREVAPETSSAGRTMGRLGDKVFIGPLWRALATTPGYETLTLDRFKRQLLDANRSGTLILARIDVAGAVDPVEYRESEISDRGSTFHAVIDPGPIRRNPAKRRRPISEDDDEDPDDLSEEDHRVLDELDPRRAHPTDITVTPEIAGRLVMLRKAAQLMSDEGAQILLSAIDRSLISGKVDKRAQESLELWSDEDLRDL